jgi:phosphohistidine phosphatase
MKSLLLLRHAKSSRDDPSLRDFDRPLNDRGKGDAKLMGRFMRDQGIQPELVISSPAKRAQRTAELVLKAAGLTITPVYDKRIYEAEVHHLMQVISEIESSINLAMLVGHNPGFEELFHALTGESRDFPTAALARIELNAAVWDKVRLRSGKAKWMQTPRELKSDE